MLPESITIDKVKCTYKEQDNGNTVTVGYDNGFEFIVASTSNCKNRAEKSLHKIISQSNLI